MNKSTVWKVCCCLVTLLAMLAFTPLVIPPGQVEPLLLGMPRTLWSGLLIAFAVVAITCIGAMVRSDEQSE